MSPRSVKISPAVVAEMIEHARSLAPEEACGLLAGATPGEISKLYPVENDAHSAILYTVNPKDHLRADRDADDQGLIIQGVYHSHTHSEAYPSPTDVGQAPDPNWYYVLVSLREPEALMRCFAIVDGQVIEDQLI
ncbi:MAG: M67 family metallopeptidase [Actinomycetota bacterium]